MEAAKVPEEPHTTMDANEHPSSKDPSAENLQEEHTISEQPLEPSTSKTPLEPQTSEDLPSSQTRLGKYVSESSLDPSIFGTSTEPPTSEVPLVPSVSQVFSETYGNTSLPVIPINQEELMEMVKTREQFGAQLYHLFQWEKSEALNAIQTGVYIGWRCPHYLWDCFRIGEESKCFCGHLLKEHQIISDVFVPCSESQCRCLMFCFIPSRPEEVGEFWLKRRATFDPKAWRAQCRCKHNHEEHAATGTHPCKYRGCGCKSFESNFLCAACDRRWEDHETFFETEGIKRRKKKAHGSHSSSSWHRAF
ncbi:protein FAM221B [Perognathus longimembris pacificus]|uniref:protein FAM221B n=1 Tax=Perognathus longimembris pacificus TaxID=214514 RepID=UPI0020197F31|nr:protein FAM221B [Perognathus longimembris pacificus]